MNQLLILFLLVTSSVYSQSINDGTAVITHWAGGAGQYYSFSLFETSDNSSASLGGIWDTEFITPSDPNIHDSWLGENMGQVFGIAIDSDNNIYFSSSKTVSILGSDYNFSGIAGDGGVYKMDPNTLLVTPFIFTGNGTNQIPNIGLGLGNIAYDKWNNQLFITNFEDGKIYRYDTQGNQLSTFDPFSLDASELGVFCGQGEALWGINLNKENGIVKVYFSQWTEDNTFIETGTVNNSVWSVDLDDFGEFVGQESLCFSLEDHTNTNFNGLIGASYPISDITFSSSGSMYVCEKVMGGNQLPFGGGFNGGANVLDIGYGAARVFEYQKINSLWTVNQQYSIGNFGLGNADNCSGGIAIGNRNLESGQVECEKLLWSAGDGLRYVGYQPIDEYNEYAFGAAGVPIEGNTLENVSTTSIYVDVEYSSDFVEEGGGSTPKFNFGDIEIYRDPNSQSALTISPNTTICNGESVQLNISGGSNYEWSPALTLDDSNSASPIATPTENTTYTVTGEVGDCGGGGTASVTINIDDFNFSLGPDVVNCVTAEGQTLDAGEEAQSYLWNTGETTQTINAITTGDYTVNVVSPAGCDYSDEISLINSQAPTLAFSTPNNGSCPPATFTLNDESIPIESDPIVAWNWQVDGNNYNNSITSIGLQNSGSYAVTLEVTTELGCVETLTIDDYLNVFSVPTPEFITEPAQLSKCDKTIEIINLSSDFDSLSWNFGDGITINEDTVSSYTYSEVSDYTIALTTVNSLGCESTFYKQIIHETSIPFFASNAFTPDSDALNEVFIPLIGCHENFEFWVFNRWGENIFYSNDINKGWDGTYKDQLSPIGIYSWKARYDGTKDNQVKFGEVHLMH